MSNLIECIDCGKQVSKRATTCPNCGAPVKLTVAEIEKPKKSYVQIEQEKLEAKLGTKKKSIEIHKVEKKDPNRNLIIVIVSIAAFFFLLWASTTDTGKKIWDSEYRECREVWREFVCKQD